jgi:hypothetical protein
MLKKKICERCGKTYRLSTTGSDAKGKSFCQNCICHCSVCGVKLPHSREFGAVSASFVFYHGDDELEKYWREHPDWGSGICFACETASKLEKESETTKWKCEYCNGLNEIKNKQCFNCGSPRKLKTKTKGI